MTYALQQRASGSPGSGHLLHASEQHFLSEPSHHDTQPTLIATQRCAQIDRPKRKVILFKPLRETPVTLAKGPGKDVTETGIAVKTVTQPIVIARQLAPCYGKITTPEAGSLSPHAPPPSPTPAQAEGSWKDRKTVHQLCRNRPDSPSMKSRLTAKQDNAQNNHQSRPESTVSAACSADKAWRQRFVHKWRREQARPCKICNDDMCDDPWHAALHMLQAANVHPDLQMPMPDHDCYPVRASPFPLLSIDDDLDCILEADNIIPAGAVSTTTKIQSALSEAACRARQLLEHQVALVKI